MMAETDSGPQLEQRLAANVAAIRERVRAAARAAGRDPAEIRLVAVTKYVGPEVIRALLRGGLHEFGESRVQQLTARAEALGAELGGISTPPAPGVMGPRWHLVGALQRNKVRAALRATRIIHSVNSLRLAEAIDRICGEEGLVADVLLEVNAAAEATKQGAAPETLTQLAAAVGGLAHIRLRGLMTMAPRVENPAEARPYFAWLQQQLAEYRRSGVVGPACDQLSMGMSDDFEAAILEGATMIRVGSSLFEGLAADAVG